MKKLSLEDVGKTCPVCKQKLHLGQHHYDDGMFLIEYCKECGFRTENTIV